MTNLLILTCARTKAAEPWDYITQTLPQIDRENVPFKKGIVCDGPYGGPRPPGWEVYEYSRPPGNLRVGNKLPYWHLLRVGRELGGDLVALEDDIMLSKNAARRMATFPIPDDLAWVQFFSPMVLRTWDTWPGLWRPPLSSSSFLQAVKFPARTLDTLVAWSERPEFSMHQESDNALALAAAGLRLAYGAHCPDLVQHTGEISEAQEKAMTLGDRRVSVCWGGPNFDAMALYQRDDLYR